MGSRNLPQKTPGVKRGNKPLPLAAINKDKAPVKLWLWRNLCQNNKDFKLKFLNNQKFIRAC